MRCALLKEVMKTGRQLCRDGELNIASTFMSEVSESKDVYAVPTDLFYRKCVLIQSRDKRYVIPLQCNVERDKTVTESIANILLSTQFHKLSGDNTVFDCCKMLNCQALEN